jgi:hypothetical protein
MAEAHAYVVFDAADAQDAEAIVASWSMPGATGVQVTVLVMQTSEVPVNQPTGNSPAVVGDGRAQFAPA